MLIYSPAKLNIFLRVTGKTPEFYHNIESLLVFIDLFDEIFVQKSEEFSVKFTGEFSHLVDPIDNLFTKIFTFFATEFSQKISVKNSLKLTVKKNIPVGAGLGGGSSNAAYFMSALNQIFSLNLTKKDLQKISLKFGSDIAFFFENQAAIVSGRGDEIALYQRFDPIPALLINPKIFLSTKEVFSAINGNFSLPIAVEKLQQKNIFDLIGNFPNDLASPAIAMVPVIQEILDGLILNQAKSAKMSGSGSSCFGIFSDEEKLDAAFQRLSKQFPEFFIRKIKILSHV